jgi:glucose-6-phosphate dehydrogenase assembly protein OpcA
VADLQQSILLDAPKEVDITTIERELTQLWKQAAEDSSEGAPVVRACSLNLIIFSEGTDRASGLEEIVSQVTVDHPSRIFLVSADRRAGTPGVEAWVSARCSLPVPGGKQVCCEEINLVAKGIESNKVPSIVTSLVVPDIPTILIWKARLDLRDNVLQMLTQIADRVLIDSSEELHPISSLVSWGEFIEERLGRTAFGDLAWTHLAQWRTLLAQAFQPADARAHLLHLNAVTIEYSETSMPAHSGLSQALLATGWLAHALGWVLVHPIREVDDGVYDAKFRLDDQAITVRLVQVTSKSTRPGGIESIVCHSSLGGEIVNRWAERENCILLHTSLPGVASGDTILSVRHQTEAELVTRELEVLYHDPSYEASMSMLSTMLASR